MRDQPEIIGRYLGLFRQVFTDTAWVEVTSATFKNWNGAANPPGAVAASLSFNSIVIKNDGAAIVYAYGRTEVGLTDAGDATNALPVAAGSSITVPLRGTTTTTIALRASAADATGCFLIATFD